MDEVRLADQAREPQLGDVLTWGGDGWEPRSDGPRAFGVTHVHTERQITVAMGPQRSPNFVSGSTGWQISEDGSAEFNDVVVRGTLYATVGEIGGWTINADNIAGGDAVLHSGGYLLLGTGDDVVRVDAQNATWRLWVGDASGGDAPFRVSKAGEVWATNITARGEIRTAVLRYDEIHATSGMLLVTPNAAKLAVDLMIGSMGYFNVGEAGRFAVNDIVRLKDGTNDVWLSVMSDGGDGTYGYTLSSGSEDVTFEAGTAVVGYGASGEGGVLLDAADAHAPFVDVFTHAGSPWSSVTTKTRMGNLSGITDADLNPTGYGLYCDNVYLKGALVSEDVTIDNSGITIEANPGESGPTNTIKWKKDGDSNNSMEIRGFTSLSGSDVVKSGFVAVKESDVGQVSNLSLIAYGYIGREARVNIKGRTNTVGGKVQVYISWAQIGEFTDQGLLLRDGSASAPSLSFLSDVNTGIYRSAANQLSIAAGGSERVRITGSGEMLIQGGTGCLTIETAAGNSSARLILVQRNASHDGDSFRVSMRGDGGPDVRASAYDVSSGTFRDLYKFFYLSSKLQMYPYVGFGVTTPSYRVELPNTASVSGRGRANQWVTYSDARCKRDEEKMSDALALLMKLRPVRYKAVNCEKGEDKLEFGEVARGWSYGLIAQELEKVMADVVYRPEDETCDLWGISYTELIPWLVAAVQELAGRVQ